MLPNWRAGTLWTMNVWVPNWFICSSMLLCMTRMAVMTTMIEKTPTSTPSNVSAERSLWAASAPIAMRKLSRSSAAKVVEPLEVMYRSVDADPPSPRGRAVWTPLGI